MTPLLKNYDVQLVCYLCNIKQKKMVNFCGNVSNVGSNILFQTILMIMLKRVGARLDDKMSEVASNLKTKNFEIIFC